MFFVSWVLSYAICSSVFSFFCLLSLLYIMLVSCSLLCSLHKFFFSGSSLFCVCFCFLFCLFSLSLIQKFPFPSLWSLLFFSFVFLLFFYLTSSLFYVRFSVSLSFILSFSVIVMFLLPLFVLFFCLIFFFHFPLC